MRNTNQKPKVMTTNDKVDNIINSTRELYPLLGRTAVYKNLMNEIASGDTIAVTISTAKIRLIAELLNDTYDTIDKVTTDVVNTAISIR